jgi:hypothetical protein
MEENDVLIGKIVSFSLMGIGAILFVIASSKLFFYDAEENGLMTLTEGTFNVEDDNEGYRIYTKHNNCEEVDVDLYYESSFNMGDLIWTPACGGDLIEFSSATSGDWHYVGTLTFQATYNPGGNEVTVDFNVSASHEVMITDREPIEGGLGFRTISFAFLALGGLIIGVTKKVALENEANQESSEGIFQNRISSTNNKAALDALALLKRHIVVTNTSHTELFSSFDLNDDGTIDHFELMNGLKSVGIEGLSPIDIGDLVSLLDINGNGKIDLHELGRELDQNL